eukprot:CAMPEP_0206312186 /NCGR_PEP_ID=MMETSP0106_2-20121207/13858_1 /ASSEMBLY_ACC=CAM_ASM_000206 /TAXON_ID=81532 /ORGANISM="Acanthoeca-like sp., Strain 10tr" /LENGTH=48 /DNA_ID= /DNA_START= /DNA_END= /DNA_ORIENTATION=
MARQADTLMGDDRGRGGSRTPRQDRGTRRASGRTWFRLAAATAAAAAA